MLELRGESFEVSDVPKSEWHAADTIIDPACKWKPRKLQSMLRSIGLVGFTASSSDCLNRFVEDSP